MRIFSGIRASGDKTLGNYSGGFRQYAATQEEGDAFFCIVDLHSITVEHDPEVLRRATLDVGAMLFAAGLDPEREEWMLRDLLRANRGPLSADGLAAIYAQILELTKNEVAGTSARA